MNNTPITNRKENFEAYQLNKFGNKLRLWTGLDEFRKSNYNGSVTFRYYAINNGGSSNFTKYDVTDYEKQIKEFTELGAEPKRMIFNESAPDKFLTIQGELTHDYNGYQLFYSTDKGKMRDCLKNGKTLTGLAVKLLLQQHLNSNSFSDIMELIELYPNHVIEFSTYSINLGDCPRRNTIIWEVRRY
jgi:hypothetical protein